MRFSARYLVFVEASELLRARSARTIKWRPGLGCLGRADTEPASPPSTAALDRRRSEGPGGSWGHAPGAGSHRLRKQRGPSPRGRLRADGAASAHLPRGADRRDPRCPAALGQDPAGLIRSSEVAVKKTLARGRPSRCPDRHEGSAGGTR
ncbi:hypothetical protein NDU88_000920 [Pleurodeles waltl]|uniref:Uncharacterized protein n=1 Tax=Pleurodeles waltl TaxID=8319 RepID=A0AAV7UUJ3_PLEWA|nr:hypothetical protein NDU88_000920 [Pleurodeles waltl]